MALDTFTNFAYGTLNAGIAADAVSVTLTAGHGARFPATAFNAVIWDMSYASVNLAYHAGAAEIVRVTARSTDTLTITRAQESTTARAFNTSGRVYALAQMWTNKTVEDIDAISLAITAETDTTVTIDTGPQTDALAATQLQVDTGTAEDVWVSPATLAGWSGGGGGSGTVTKVSVATANGVSGSVANDTTTPAITITLGAITPTTVNGVTVSGTSTPTLAVTGTTAVSGTNTGDDAVNSNYSSLVTNATHTGDATGSTTLTLATVNANVGSFGSATAAGTFTVNAKGLVTAAGSTTVTPAVGSITGLGTGVAAALAVNVGSAGAPVVNGGALGTPSSGTLTSCTVKVEFGFACSDETTALTTGEKVAFYAPFAFTLTGVYACVTTAPTGASLTVDVEKPAGTSLLSAVATISASGFTGTGTVSGGTQSISQGDRVSIDIDQIGSTIAGAGLKVFLTGTRS